jgi:hypothetical protein
MTHADLTLAPLHSGERAEGLPVAAHVPDDALEECWSQMA